jgi:hypothetical protein
VGEETHHDAKADILLGATGKLDERSDGSWVPAMPKADGRRTDDGGFWVIQEPDQNLDGFVLKDALACSELSKEIRADLSIAGVVAFREATAHVELVATAAVPQRKERVPVGFLSEPFEPMRFE